MNRPNSSIGMVHDHRNKNHSLTTTAISNHDLLLQLTNEKMDDLHLFEYSDDDDDLNEYMTKNYYSSSNSNITTTTNNLIGNNGKSRMKYSKAINESPAIMNAHTFTIQTDYLQEEMVTLSSSSSVFGPRRRGIRMNPHRNYTNNRRPKNYNDMKKKVIIQPIYDYYYEKDANSKNNNSNNSNNTCYNDYCKTNAVVTNDNDIHSSNKNDINTNNPKHGIIQPIASEMSNDVTDKQEKVQMIHKVAKQKKHVSFHESTSSYKNNDNESAMAVATNENVLIIDRIEDEYKADMFYSEDEQNQIRTFAYYYAEDFVVDNYNDMRYLQQMIDMAYQNNNNGTTSHDNSIFQQWSQCDGRGLELFISLSLREHNKKMSKSILSYQTKLKNKKNYIMKRQQVQQQQKQRWNDADDTSTTTANTTSDNNDHNQFDIDYLLAQECIRCNESSARLAQLLAIGDRMEVQQCYEQEQQSMAAHSNEQRYENEQNQKQQPKLQKQSSSFLATTTSWLSRLGMIEI